jgi:hypothetical protein
MSGPFSKPPSLLTRGIGFLRWFVSNLPHMLTSGTPRGVWVQYLRTFVRRPSLERYAGDKRRFQQAMQGARVSYDWFSGNIPYWLAAFHRHGLFDRPVRVLEVGSWEGLSSRFILDTLPRAHLTCVDVWAGDEEPLEDNFAANLATHKGRLTQFKSTSYRGLPMSHVEDNFDANLAPHKGRLTKIKSTSFEFFSSQLQREQFDLVYIDGSHHCDDVIIDAIQGFDQLKVGGILIFDDYLWRSYKRRADNPAAAINAFLRLKAGCYDLFMVYAQVILCKTAGRQDAAAPVEASTAVHAQALTGR